MDPVPKLLNESWNQQPWSADEDGYSIPALQQGRLPSSSKRSVIDLSDLIDHHELRRELHRQRQHQWLQEQKTLWDQQLREHAWRQAQDVLEKQLERLTGASLRARDLKPPSTASKMPGGAGQKCAPKVDVSTQPPAASRVQQPPPVPPAIVQPAVQPASYSSSGLRPSTLTLTRSQAARIIQKWWRGWSIWGKHRDALSTLLKAASLGRQATSKISPLDGSNVTVKQVGNRFRGYLILRCKQIGTFCLGLK